MTSEKSRYHIMAESDECVSRQLKKDKVQNFKEAAVLVLENLDQVESSLNQLVLESASGKYGYITREWGFTTPNGLGGKLGGKFESWETKLSQVKEYFWPAEAYAFMEKSDGKMVKPHDLPRKAERLQGNLPLHEFLLQPPSPSVQLEESDLEDYRSAARIFLLLCTLSHLCGNSAPGPKTTPLPEWIEVPLQQAAERLQVSPTLTGFFVTQENWAWKPSLQQHPKNLITSDHDSAKAIVQVLLDQRHVRDRRYRLKIYKDCFVGSQAINVLMDNGFASSREEAARIGRKINEAFGLFSHVTNDHLLKDKELFYRFRKKWRHKNKSESSYEGSQGNDDESFNEGAGESEEDLVVSILPVRKSSRSKRACSIDGKNKAIDESANEGDAGKSKDNPVTGFLQSSFRSSSHSSIERRTNNKSFDESENEVDSGESEANAPSRVSSLGQSSRVGSSIGASIKSNNKVVDENDEEGDADDSEENLVMGFLRGGSIRRSNRSKRANSMESKTSNMSIEPDLDACLKQALLHSGKITTGKSEDDGSCEGTAAAIVAMRCVPVRNRRYRLKLYRNCFIGSQLIDVLIQHECASSRLEALRLARAINNEYRLFEHVCHDHDIADDYLFYRFTAVFKQMTDTKSLSDSDAAEPPSTLTLGYDSPSSSLKPMSSPRADSARSVGSQDSFGDYDASGCFEEPDEFRFDNIEMLYAAFGNDHEKSNQLIPCCMGYALRILPFTVIDILATMRDFLEAKLNEIGVMGEVDSQGYADDAKEAQKRLSDLLFQAAFSLSRCKEQFQRMTTDPTKRAFNSKHISIRQTQPLSNGVLVGGKRRKGVSGTQFPYFHLLDWLLGRYQFIDDSSGGGFISQLSSVDDCYPPPQKEFILRLSALNKSSTLRGFLDLIGRPQQLMVAYNHLIECYAGEGGVLTAHHRKLYSYMHNDVQVSTSGTTHAGKTGIVSNQQVKPSSLVENNHRFAKAMFGHMRKATDERWSLRVAPLMSEVKKIVYSTSESGGFTTVALEFGDTGFRYEYGDVVRVLLPNDIKDTIVWIRSLSSDCSSLKLSDMPPDNGNGWGWPEVWEALGWQEAMSLETVAQYIDAAKISGDTAGESRWINSPLDLCGNEEKRMFSPPPTITQDRIESLVPISPRIYSVAGVETDRVFLLVSKPVDGTRHHGYERMSDPRITQVHCSFSPSTHFLIPPLDANLVCVASGTGISPFVGLADNIGARRGSYTIVHQCKSSDMFLANCQTWLDFTALNPGACVFGYTSGDRSRRNCPMRFVIAQGMVEETVLLNSHSSAAYYFQCSYFQHHLKEVFVPNGLNLAYCCGGVKSAVEPLKNVVDENGWKYEFTVESYNISTNSKSDFSCLIGGSVVDLGLVAPFHEGAAQILHHEHNLALANESSGCPMSSTPDLSESFWDLHPHAYNLHRSLQSPPDADFEAYASFLERRSRRMLFKQQQPHLDAHD